MPTYLIAWVQAQIQKIYSIIGIGSSQLHYRFLIALVEHPIGSDGALNPCMSYLEVGQFLIKELEAIKKFLPTFFI